MAFRDTFDPAPAASREADDKAHRRFRNLWDAVDWWLDKGSADIFLLYLEGIRRADRFRAVADKAADAGKPLIVAKVGRWSVIPAHSTRASHHPPRRQQRTNGSGRHRQSDPG